MSGAKPGVSSVYGYPHQEWPLVESAGLFDLNQEPMPDCGPWKAGGICGGGVVAQARVSGSMRLSIGVRRIH